MQIPEFNEIIEPNDQTEARREHLEKLRDLIGNVYPNKYRREVVQDGQTIIPDQKATITNIARFAGPIKDKHISGLAEGEKPSDEQREAANAELKQYRVRVAGRLAVPPRVMGKAAFVHLSDGIKRLQIYVRKQDAKAVNNDTGETIDEEGTAWEMFGLLDHGDFIGVEGYLFVTKTGELSVHVETIQFLSKAMFPMPDKMHGISDPELQRRYRYADLIADSLKIDHEENHLTTREVFERRAKLISGMRRFLDDAGFIEVETPMLTPKATGAAAKPFETFHEALKIPLYTRIAPELYLKRLTVGGFEKVYELNRNFRNEGLSYKHNPEFTMLEFYCAYMDVNGMMDFAEAMIKESVRKANNGNLQVKISEHDDPIDFVKFERWTMKKAIIENFPKYALPEFSDEWLENSLTVIKLQEWSKWCRNSLRKVMVLPPQSNGSVDKIDETELADAVQSGYKLVSQLHKLPYGAGQSTWRRIERDFENQDTQCISDSEVAKAIVFIFEAIAEPNLIQPTFIIDYPKSISPLSKASPNNPNIAERFELFINGMECANGFSELNDPQEQHERFADQMKERETGDDEAMIMDEDYIRALAYGMPPAAGIGIGIDRLVMLLTNRHSIRDVILFPHMRPEKREEEKGRKGEEEKEEKEAEARA